MLSLILRSDPKGLGHLCFDSPPKILEFCLSNTSGPRIIQTHRLSPSLSSSFNGDTERTLVVNLGEFIKSELNLTECQSI